MAQDGTALRGRSRSA